MTDNISVERWMVGAVTPEALDPIRTAAELLDCAARAAKCAPCGCARHAVEAISAAPVGTSAELAAALEALRARLVEERYDCLGCPVCWPAQALGLLGDAGAVVDTTGSSCPSADPGERAGWPPLPGAYQVLRWRAPVAVCTLADAELADAIARAAGPETSIVGTLATENLGIERLVHNVVTNPNLRFVVVCGPETRHAVGHLPGASLLALARNGVDPPGRIVGAPGRRPVLRNLSGEEIAAFRSVVDVIDLIGVTDPAAIAEASGACAERNPGPTETVVGVRRITPIAGRLPRRMTPDTAGYFVIYPDPARGVLTLEHYHADGTLDLVIEGTTAAHCYTPAIDGGLVSRLDHAAYLGRELARAEAALRASVPYVQDAAPEEITVP